MLFHLIFQIGLRGRHQLLISNCPRLFLSHVLDRMLGKSIADIVDGADGRFAIVREGARIRHLAIARRRLDKVNGRLLHIVLDMMGIRIKVETTKVVH